MTELTVTVPRVCRVCGCTDAAACDGGCAWRPDDGRGPCCTACDPDALPSPPLPPLTAEDLAAGSGFTFRGVPVIEQEDGDYVFAYGHVDPDTMAGAVDDYYRHVGGFVDDPTDPEDVAHRYAVTLASPDDPEGWCLTWHGVTAQTPGAFPLTVVGS